MELLKDLNEKIPMLNIMLLLSLGLFITIYQFYFIYCHRKPAGGSNADYHNYFIMSIKNNNTHVANKYTKHTCNITKELSFTCLLSSLRNQRNNTH